MNSSLINDIYHIAMIVVGMVAIVTLPGILYGGKNKDEHK